MRKRLFGQRDDRTEAPNPARREVFLLIGSAAAGMLGCGGDTVASPSTTASPSASPSASPTTTASSCVVRPQLTEGPYFVDERLNRSDIRTDPSTGAARPGVALRLTFRVTRSSGGGCAPLSGAFVDVWQCDALGAYSDVSDRGFQTIGQRFLRGYQATDAAGLAQFTTLYPGWYSGRAVHIHFKIRTSLSGGGYEFTSQLFFDESLTDQVHALSPYNSKGRRDTPNASDGIYRGGGSQLLLPLAAEGAGFGGTLDVALLY